MGLFGGRQFTDEEVAILLGLVEKERAAQRRRDSQRLLAVPKYTLFPGVLRDQTIAILRSMGCQVDWLGDTQGHGVRTPRGSRYHQFVQVIQDMQPELYQSGTYTTAKR